MGSAHMYSWKQINRSVSAVLSILHQTPCTVGIGRQATPSAWQVWLYILMKAAVYLSKH